MHVVAALLARFFLPGFGLKPDDCMCAAPMFIPNTATYWLDTFDVEALGIRERFLSDDKVRAVALLTGCRFKHPSC